MTGVGQSFRHRRSELETALDAMSVDGFRPTEPPKSSAIRGRERGSEIRVHRTSKNYRKYGISWPDDNFFPASPTPPTNLDGEAPDRPDLCGTWDEKGHSSHARIEPEKSSTNFEKRKRFKGVLYKEGENVPKRPTSHCEIFFTARADLREAPGDW